MTTFEVTGSGALALRRAGQAALIEQAYWGMEPFVIREATPEDLPAMLAIINTSTPHPYTLERYSEEIQQLKELMHFFRQWVLEDGRGRVAGTLSLFGLSATELFVRPVVAPESRNRGYGSALLDCALTARPHGAGALNAQVPDTNPEMRAWAEQRGFSFDFHRFESVLDLTTFDETSHASLPERLSSTGITFQDMGTLGQDEANWTRLYSFFIDRNQETPDWGRCRR